MENGRFAQIVRDIGGSPHVLTDSQVAVAPAPGEEKPTEATAADDVGEQEPEPPQPPVSPTPQRPRAIFLGHGKKKGPLEKLQKVLTTFQIPYKVSVEEANLARPIPQKLKDTMALCGSAILIFTCDEKLCDEDGNVIWRPSENVIHELGAASYAYEDRVVIFKEKGLHLPTNFQSIGYIEFEEDSIEAKTTDLLKELVGFGLVKITGA